MIEDMDSNETEVFPIKKALEISVPSSLASQLNWAVESDSVSSQAMDDAASLNFSISINGNSENSGLSSRFERGKLWSVIIIAQLDFIASSRETLHLRLAKSQKEEKQR
ncbi:hypothetical protein NC651_007763 [Populus alba x Populus x berolinensis]|nr:hypothetical protein NC651_007763 [Populus alba x Populus x berolinensis]